MKKAELLLGLSTIIKETKLDIDTSNSKVYKPVIKAVNNFVSIIQKDIADFRTLHLVKYPIEEIIILCFFAIIQNCETYQDIYWYGHDNLKFLKRFSSFKNGIPSHDTIRRIFIHLDNEILGAVFTKYILKLLKKARKYYERTGAITHTIIDGKFLKGSGRKYNTSEEQKCIGTLNIYDAGSNLTILSQKITEKDSEIPLAQKALKHINIKNSVLSMDALHCQRETVSLIIKKRADYVIGLKGNQHDFFSESCNYFYQHLAEIKGKEGHYYKPEVEKNRGYVETREYFMMNSNEYYQKEKWAGLKNIVLLKTRRFNTVTKQYGSDEYRYYITSLNDLESIAMFIRGHWQIENNLHWHLDVTMGEDSSLIANQNAALNFSSLRKTCLSFIKLLRECMPQKTSLKGTRKRLGWNPDIQMIRLFTILNEDQILKGLSDL